MQAAPRIPWPEIGTLNATGPWTHRVVEQLTMFPVGKNDDISDAISQASIWLQINSYEFGLLDYFKSLATGKRKLPASVMRK